MITALKNSFTGLAKPSRHMENRNLHGGWMFLLIFLLSVITAVLFVQPINKAKKAPGLDEALNQLPQFTYSNGELTMEEQYMLPLVDNTNNTRSILFYLDTDVDSNSLSQDALAQYADMYNCSQVLALARDGIIAMQAGRANVVPYKTFLFFLGSNVTISNANIKEIIIKIISWTSTICAVIMSVCYIGIFYFCLLIYALIGLIINAILSSNYGFTNYGFGDLYKTAFSVALPLWLLKAVLCMFLTGGAETLVKWLIRLVIIAYFFFAMYLKKKEDEQLAIQAAARSNSQDEIDINSFMGSHEMDDFN
ncbi:MAG: DUF1189 domain-containing protein [Ruminococcus flavefaciens]|nr:DUF1189 domain-containing protein [Ruminococcus flavefaciens]